MGGAGDLARTVGDGIAGLVTGALAAIGDAFWTIVNELQVLLPGPLFYLVVGGGFLALLLWTIRK
jgi:hypothetical protein